MTVVALKSPLKSTRIRHQFSVAEAARGLGVSIPELTRWEKSLDGVPEANLRDLAIFYGVNVSDLTGIDAPEGPLHEWPYALERVSEKPPYGTLKVGFPFGVREYPIDEGARAKLLHGMAQFDVQGEDPKTSWLSTWSMDNRLLYFNLDHVDWIDLHSDDDEEMPDFEHPEVYFALETLDIDEVNHGPILQRALERVVERSGSLEDAVRTVRGSLAIAPDGRELWHHMLEESDTMALFIMELTHDMQVARNALVEMSSEGFHVSRHINVGRYAVIEFPAEQYARLSRDE